MVREQLCVSIIVPVLNEADVLPDFLPRLEDVVAAIQATDLTVEVIFNDNKSADNSAEILDSFCETHAWARVNRFVRNYGFQNSLLYGLQTCSGDCAVFLQSDLQDPPELVVDMVAAWRQGNVTVAGLPTTRQDHRAMLATRKVFYRVMSWISGQQSGRGVQDFYLMDRCVIDELKAAPTQGQFLRGRIGSSFGFECVLPYPREARVGGSSKFTFTDLYDLGMNGILLQNSALVRRIGIAGTLVALLSILGLVSILVAWVLGVRTGLSGWFSLASFLLLIIGVVSVGFALVIEYLNRVAQSIFNPIAMQVRSVSKPGHPQDS